MADLFGFAGANITSPITADKCTISFGGTIAGATQVSIQYAQQINRRRTIGNQVSLIWGAQPQGQATIQRLVTGGLSLGGSGWSACTPGTVTFNLGGCAGSGGSVTASGAVVSQYSISAEAESLTVMDNVVIDFMYLSA
jgi:hypothetical protein